MSLRQDTQLPNKKFANILFLAGFDEIDKFSARQYFYVYGISGYSTAQLNNLHNFKWVTPPPIGFTLVFVMSICKNVV